MHTIQQMFWRLCGRYSLLEQPARLAMPIPNMEQYAAIQEHRWVHISPADSEQRCKEAGGIVNDLDFLNEVGEILEGIEIFRASRMSVTTLSSRIPKVNPLSVEETAIQLAQIIDERLKKTNDYEEGDRIIQFQNKTFVKQTVFALLLLHYAKDLRDSTISQNYPKLRQTRDAFWRCVHCLNYLYPMELRTYALGRLMLTAQPILERSLEEQSWPTTREIANILHDTYAMRLSTLTGLSRDVLARSEYTHSV